MVPAVVTIEVDEMAPGRKQGRRLLIPYLQEMGEVATVSALDATAVLDGQFESH